MKRKRLKLRQRLRLLKKYNGRCAYCGELISYEELIAEHLKPLSRDGTNKRKNFMPSCITCDREKGKMLLEEYRALKEIKYFYFEKVRRNFRE